MDGSRLYQYGCLICGEELDYKDSPVPRNCHFCNREYKTDVYCKNDHFVCDRCHSSSAMELIEKNCISTGETDPGKIIMRLMDNRAFSMHGPEHHFLVPAALLACYHNLNNSSGEKEQQIKKARQRAGKVPGGFCGTHGNCGAAVGAGIFVSIATGATPLTTESWQLSQLVTADCLKHIALAGGPRCCKRDSFIALERAVEFTLENLNTDMKMEAFVCSFSSDNRQCLKKECRFYDQSG